jgi:flavin reductase (DIM6/NTAB) family NADH-FMN oxidoreductase RutF
LELSHEKEVEIMPKVVTEAMGKFSHHYPRVAALVSASAGGRDDVMTAAWHTFISLRPPLYGVAITTKRFTYQLAMESREFGVNFVPAERASLAAGVGGTSGHQIDKFEKFSIEKEKSLKTGAPVLKDAYAAYECKLVDTRPYGDHVWVVGEIVAVHFLEEAFTPTEVLDLEKMKPLLYLGSDYYASTDKKSVDYVKRGI